MPNAMVNACRSSTPIRKLSQRHSRPAPPGYHHHRPFGLLLFLLRSRFLAQEFLDFFTELSLEDPSHERAGTSALLDGHLDRVDPVHSGDTGSVHIRVSCIVGLLVFVVVGTDVLKVLKIEHSRRLTQGRASKGNLSSQTRIRGGLYGRSDGHGTLDESLVNRKRREKQLVLPHAGALKPRQVDMVRPGSSRNLQAVSALTALVTAAESLDAVIERTTTVLLVFLDLLRRAVFADERRSSGRLLNLRSFGVRHLDFDLRLLGSMLLRSVLLLLFFRGSLTTQAMSEERP
jgi:hypothetical protein